MGNSIYFRSVKTNAIVRGSDLKVIIDVFGVDTLVSLITDGDILESISEPSIEEAIAANNINLAVILCYDANKRDDHDSAFTYQDALNMVLKIKQQMDFVRQDSNIDEWTQEEKMEDDNDERSGDEKK